MTTQFRNALQVSPERIAALNDSDLSSLLRGLLLAQASRCGASASEIRVNTEGRAKDEGCDAWSPRVATPDPWLGSVETCWQLKAGRAGEPAKLTGEVAKPIPKATLAAGGRVVIVASGSTNGIKGERERLSRARSEADAEGLTAGIIDVIGSERLATWCNQHPAVAAPYANRPVGLCTLAEWELSEEHQVAWQSTPGLEQKIDAWRADLDFTDGSVFHLHIEGLPGVGKTRLALELCRGAKWSSHVVYFRQTSDERLAEIIDTAAREKDVRLVLVADEVQPEDLRPLRDAVERGQGRIRLITIGHCGTPDWRRIPAFKVVPLEREPMTNVIKGWYPSMPPEHVDFVVRFADGYIRLARLTADSVARNPSIDVQRLLSQDDIAGFLDSLLGPGDRHPLYVVAVLTSVGWTDDRQQEGEAIAAHLGFDWNHVRATVDDFHRHLNIVPSGGRYRYISPTPLGIHLAVEAWKTFPDQLKKLASALPSEEARNAYYDRLKEIASNPQARQFAREELSFFFRLDDFIDPRAVRQWSALSASDPALASRNIARALSGATSEKRRRVANRARREIVWTLVRLAWKGTAFHDAATALALLAEAENESWSNNATGEFIARFQVFLGGTAKPYLDRLRVLDELVAVGRPELTRLVVRALKQVGNRQAMRMGGEPLSDELPEPEWRPVTQLEHLSCLLEAVDRLVAIAREKRPELEDELATAATDLFMLLRDSPIRERVASFFEAVRDSYPESRETLRRSIADVLQREKKYWKELTPEDLAFIEALHGRFEDPSLSARLRQYVGQPLWDRDGEVDLVPIATELVSIPQALAAEWTWLTSGEANDAWALGQALAEVSTSEDLDSFLPGLSGRGRDLRVLCGYIYRRRQTQGDGWFEDWLAAQLARSPDDMQLLFEVSWRCGATVNSSKCLSAALRTRKIEPHVVGQLAFGRWGEDLPTKELEDLLRALADSGHGATALHVLEHTLKSRPRDASELEEFALDLVTRVDVIRTDQTLAYYWSEVTSMFIPRHARRIAAAILAAQGDRRSGIWFAEHGPAASVLSRCVSVDPGGVWQDLTPYLTSPADAYIFGIGFPEGILDQMPVEDVVDWVSQAPADRAAIIAQLVNKDFSADDTLASRLLGAFGDNEGVASAFFSSFLSGGWTGPASAHWEQRAVTLEQVVQRTRLPKLRRWAEDGVQSLKRMAMGERQQEEEEAIRRR